MIMLYGIIIYIILICDIKTDENYIKGVKKSMQNLYINKDDKFYCLDKLKIIPYNQINDDYCDCLDGSDEPGTNACNDNYYWCRNIGYRESKIPSYKIDDNECDCCDGSDEQYQVCPNICVQLADKERKERQEKIDIINEGNNKIQQFFQNIKQFLDNIKNQIQSTNNKLSELNQQKNQILNMSISIQIQLDNEKMRFNHDWQNECKFIYADDIFTHLDINHDKKIEYNELESSSILHYYNLSYFNYDHHSPPIRKFHFIQNWIKIDNITINNQEEETHLPPVQDENHDDNQQSNDENDDDNQQSDDNNHYERENHEEIEYGEDGVEITKRPHHSQHSYNKLPRQPLIHHPRHINNDLSSKKFKDLHRVYLECLQNPENDQIIRLKNQQQENENQLQNIISQINFTNSHLTFLLSYDSLDFGPSKTYAYLFNTCFHVKVHFYNYTICPFYYATQITPHGSYIIGKWSHWDTTDQPPYTKMVYTNGDLCYNELYRSFTITLECYKENLITVVDEVESCTYHIHLKTPASCYNMEIPTIHDEL